MQAAFESGQQEDDEDGKGQDPLAGKRLIGRSMLGDESGIVEGFSEFAEEFGMDVAKPCSYPLHSRFLQ